jgi:NAD(P)-dependent dehydrogenase (short-subunit alcohol dehydrogenase family)
VIQLEGKSAIVTGAAVGIGNSYAHALAKAGVNLGICDLREDVHAVADSLKQYGVKVTSSQGDVADPIHVRDFVDQAAADLGSIDILINNAGVCRTSSPKDDLDRTLADYESLVGTNLKGKYLFGRAVIPMMIDQGTGGEIINIATDHIATCGSPYFCCPKLDSCPYKDAPRPTGAGVMDIYDASQWAQNGLLYAWAKALAPHNIRVNALCMGATDSHMIRSFFGSSVTQEDIDKWMQPEDIARVMIELLEEGPSGRNAQSINFCMGRPVQLEAPHEHLYVREQQVALKATV